MAPANGAANLRKGPGGRPRVKNPVVPAIPLPYIQRRAQHQVVAATQPAPAQTNGDAQVTPKGTPAEPARDESAQVIIPNGTQVEGEVNSAASDSSSQANPAPQTPSAPSTSSTAGDNSQDSTNGAPRPDSPKSASAPNDEMNVRAGPANMYPPPSNIPTHMPPPFFPANPPDGMYGMDGPRPAHHQPHPSNSSLHFGGFHESNSSSPAPHSAGYAPPPGLPLPNGRPSHMGRPSGPDFRPQSMIFGNEFEPTSIDPYGPSTASYAPPDYPLYMGNYVPSTPHSFHGSQSSAPPEEMYGQFSPFAGANGSHNPVDDGRGRAHASGPMMALPPPLGMMPPMPPPHMVPRMPEPDAEQFASHFKNSFQNPRFSDCTLELRFPDNRAPLMKMPAHRLVLSQSTFLEKLMGGDSTPRRKGQGQFSNTVAITADDKYLRTDTFITALQRLYGFPLFSIPAPPPGSDDLPLAGGAVDRFSFVVSYAAAGHLLQCLSVVVRGMEMATQLLSWDTLEPALEFALGSSEARGTIDVHERYPYGAPTRILLDGIVGFVADRILPDFVLDTSASDPKGYRRLPEVPELPQYSPNSKRASPTIVKGTSGHAPQGARRSRLTKIKFGDMSDEGSADGQNGGSGAQPQGNPSPQVAALSRVLLNLPFSCLKAILESPRLGHPEAGEARQRIAVDVVSERESRRLAAVEAVKTGRVPKLDGARRILASVEPRTADRWGVLGFQESVAPVSNAHSPHVGRAWVPLAPEDEAPGGTGWSGAAYP